MTNPRKVSMLLRFMELCNAGSYNDLNNKLAQLMPSMDIYGSQPTSDARAYRDFTIVTQKGKRRNISEPVPGLMQLQAIINSIMRSHPIPWVSSFSVDDVRNIVRTREFDTILSMDIKDFFPSTSTNVVYEAFVSAVERAPISGGFEKARAYLGDMRDMVADLFMHKGVLPQGAPTSPIIADVVMAGTDSYLRNYLNKYIPKSTYLRYADNFFILLPKDVDKRKVSMLIKTTQYKLKDIGLKLNERKTSVMRPGRAMNVLGLIANQVKEEATVIPVVKNGEVTNRKIYKTFRTMRVGRQYIEGTFRDLCAIYEVEAAGNPVSDKIYYNAIGRLQYIRHNNKRLKSCFKTVTAQLVGVTDSRYAKTLHRLVLGVKKEKVRNADGVQESRQ